MKINVGFEIVYDCPQPTPMILTLSIHYSRASDLEKPEYLLINPNVPIRAYRDGFGNWCSRIVAPKGELRLWSNSIVNDSGLPDHFDYSAPQIPVQDLPEETLVYLFGSRYCETDRLHEIAWQLFGNSMTGWSRVKGICNFVHNHVTFGYEHARPTKTAWETYIEKKGVCRDFAHLAIAFCRCVNIPARYCTGYLGDIGVPASVAPMDFSGWFEAYIGGQWFTFDARSNIPRIGRVLIAQGRDASDVAISTTFGPNTLKSFRVWTDDVTNQQS